MNKINLFLIFLIVSPSESQQNPFRKTSSYKHENLIGEWIFESMTTIKKGKREEITILYKDNKNLEILDFKDSGAILFNVLNDGIKKNGEGVWYAENDYLTIIVDSDTTYGTYTIKELKLILVINYKKTDNSHEYDTVIKYKKTE